MYLIQHCYIYDIKEGMILLGILFHVHSPPPLFPPSPKHDVSVNATQFSFVHHTATLIVCPVYIWGF